MSWPIVAQAHDADAAVDGVDEVERLPLPGALACGVLVDVAMMAQRPEDGVFAHLPDQPVIHDAHDRHVGQLVVGQQVVDAHAKRHDQLDVLERRDQAAVRLPGQGDLDIVGVSRLSSVR